MAPDQGKRNVGIDQQQLQIATKATTILVPQMTE
jgi:hypothetical protein